MAKVMSGAFDNSKFGVSMRVGNGAGIQWRNCVVVSPVKHEQLGSVLTEAFGCVDG